jgi:N-acyl homoserine lactone hydrolase
MAASMLAKTGTVSRLWALDAPILTLPAGLLVLGCEGLLPCPFPSFLIEHPQGRVLIDTGMRPEAATDPVGTYGDIGAALLPDGFPRELCVDHQLEKLGIQPGDIDTVVMTHLHLDHTGMMPLFRHAQFIGGLGEMRFAYWPDPSQQSGFFLTSDFAFLRECPDQWIEVGPYDYDLFGDGSVVLYHLPGHTPGSLGVLVRTPEQNFLLAGDVVHLRAGLTGMPFPNDWSAEQTNRSVARLKAIAKANNAQIWVGHDPEDWAITKHAPAVYDGAP